ncbi:hypothetical protein ACFOU2_21105 [Bacillus songklensis]|uniref:Uncharacterized protein n=1 Tax=Bacillus songklensis TaxID=1069116 RepID=A0ABV8B8M1_9BACI
MVKCFLQVFVFTLMSTQTEHLTKEEQETLKRLLEKLVKGKSSDEI